LSRISRSGCNILGSIILGIFYILLYDSLTVTNITVSENDDRLYDG
jgi:hypothetical protein